MGARKGILLATVLAAAVLLGWLATVDDVRIWPLRNTVEYRALRWWWERVGRPPAAHAVRAPATGRLVGTLRDTAGRPVAGGRVLVTQWDGTARDAVSGADGGYALEGVPAGAYAPVAGAPGYADTVLGDPRLPFALGRVRVPAGGAARADVRLTPQAALPPAAGATAAAAVGAAETATCERPLAGTARRRVVTLPQAGGASGQGLLYTPGPEAGPAAGGGGWPLLLTVYPGPAAAWECASVPLAAAGFAVLAVAPAYSFSPEGDVADLARWLRLARTGALPEVDGGRLAALAGSYSALHVQRLLERPEDAAALRAAVLLGAPSDLFDARRRLEDGTYVPPFGLDAALVALGFPDREPLRYWRYSWTYHVRRDLPPLALIHSRQDEVVPFQQSEALARRLEAVGAPHRLYVFDAASHYLLSEDGDALAVYDLTLAFLRERLDA